MNTAPANDDGVAFAVTDLASRLNVSPESIKVLTVENVVWSDGSTGCPQPGMNYTQALVDGRRIILEANFVTYSYHAADGREPFYCPAQLVQRPIVDPRI